MFADDSTNDRNEERSSWLRTNQGIAAALSCGLLLLLLYYLSSDWVYQVLRDKFRLGFFTLFAVGAMLACTVAMIFDRHRHSVTEGMAEFRPKALVYVVSIPLAGYAFFALGHSVGFPIMLPIVVTGAMYGLGLRPFPSCVGAGVVTSIVVFLLFWMIGERLPLGPVGRAIGAV